MFSLPQPVRYTRIIIVLTNDDVKLKRKMPLERPIDTSREPVSKPCKFMCLCLFSYLFPDGRTQNPDLTGLCEPSPQDHIKVTQVRAVHLQSFRSFILLLVSGSILLFRLNVFFGVVTQTRKYPSYKKKCDSQKEK